MSANSRRVYLDASDFQKQGYSAGSEGIVLTTSVPSTQVWRVPVGDPLVVALVAKQTVTVSSGSTESVALEPEAPMVDYVDDITAGEYSPEANVTAYFDADGDGSRDTLVTDSTDVQFTGTETVSGDFIEAVEFEETTGGDDVTVDIFTVVRHGYVTIQKRNSGKGNVSTELQREDAITWAFSNPDDPNSDRQVSWESSNSGLSGVLPPGFNLDVVFYDESHSVDVDAANATNLQLSIPVSQRPLLDDETPADLRRKVSKDMATGA
ncbi:hypothetical protein GOC74_02105 [Halomicrobium mukohataei]|uniref:Uncharacterized protein n=1 Tax=Halomicrobium mukohataei TaxID=57705 RepID=A0A847UCR6_9EURY|nr:hypothetical protein [Halomicrobium mukohataei]NLV08731.1 hypothetical protein [Halomicrobium mukohataei]